MNIPKEAIEAAATVLWGTDPTTVGVPAPITRDEWETDTDGYIEGARAALTAALPHLEAALRKQIANDPGYYAIIHISGSTWNNALYHVIEQAAPSERRGAWHSAARIAEEGALE